MAGSWSYVPNDIYKPTKELIEKLVDIVSKGGNYLLNIGPSPEGEFSDTAYARLKEIGDWMKINSEAIYGTRMYAVFGEGNNIRFTQTKDGRTKYIFLFNFPEQHLLLTKIAISKGQRLSMLGSAKKISYSQTANSLEIKLSKELKAASNHVWVLKVEG
jgi:alpha-L-fucosidase